MEGSLMTKDELDAIRSRAEAYGILGLDVADIPALLAHIAEQDKRIAELEPPGTCDWGGCDELAEFWRLGKRGFSGYLPVCSAHRGGDPLCEGCGRATSAVDADGNHLCRDCALAVLYEPKPRCPYATEDDVFGQCVLPEGHENEHLGELRIGVSR
jgi:hypothetical protein